jgi:hypothetical protein
MMGCECGAHEVIQHTQAISTMKSLCHSLVQVVAELKMCHWSSANREFLPTLKVHQVHIDHWHVQKEIENSMPPFMSSYLAWVITSKLVGNIHTTHVCGVLQIHKWSRNGFSYSTIAAWNGGSLHTFYNNQSYMSRKKTNRFLVPPPAIVWESCMRHSKEPCWELFKVEISAKISGSPIRFDQTVHVA